MKTLFKVHRATYGGYVTCPHGHMIAWWKVGETSPLHRPEYLNKLARECQGSGHTVKTRSSTFGGLNLSTRSADSHASLAGLNLSKDVARAKRKLIGRVRS